MPTLLLLSPQFPGKIDEHAFQVTSLHPFPLIELEQGLFDFHTQQSWQLVGRDPGWGLFHEALCGGQQVSVPGEPDGATGPNSLCIKSRDTGQSVVFARWE